jgi:hypothetical protein
MFIPFLLSSFGLVVAATDPGYNCQPGQKCWPSRQQWQQLNNTIDGHLHQTVPLGAPCYKNSTSYNEEACSSLESSYNNTINRDSYYGQTYWQNWEACGTSACSLLNPDPEIQLYSTCSLGRLAPYYVDVRTPSHISAALKFAKEHNIRISIKNTGHDFNGRSAVPNSLAIWTHNLQNLSFYENFTASNCPSANGKNVGEMGAGVAAGDAYRYFNLQGMDVTGGYEQSVGIAGGFGQGGGVGDFTTIYGLMVDNAVEFEVVTADGQVRVINECNDPDLFWAMRGGGGGAFAVLTKYRVQLYPSLPIHTYNLVANWSSPDVLRALLLVHAENQQNWSAELITGSVDYLLYGASVGIVLPYADDGSKLKAATASFVQAVSNIANMTISISNYTSYTSYTSYLSFSALDATATEPPGIGITLSSRLLPRSLFTSATSIDAVVDAVVYGIEQGKTLLPQSGAQVVFETPLSTPDLNRTTSAHPAWRDALWHVIFIAEWREPLDPDVQKNVTMGFLDMLEPLKTLSPGGGAYFNEASYEEVEWEQTFFGDNYPKLLKVKERYDPEHVFDCWKCVGWRGELE